MTLNSGANYRKACTNLLENALLRPHMYFQSLGELEAIMRGHATAFNQLGLISNVPSFHKCFGDWLYEKTGVSSAAGWAYAIESLASDKGEDSSELFSTLVREFLIHWSECDDTQ